MQGGCTCRNIRYRLTRRPLFVHTCHCRWCQCETGSAFVVNALIEAEAVEVTAGAPREVLTPSASGQGQRIHRCPDCHVALWSVYSGSGPLFRFVRVGTLDEPGLCPPDIHIFTASRQTWFALPEGVPAVPEYYDRDAYWPQESLARRNAVLSGR